MQVKSESSTANQNQGATLRCEHWNDQSNLKLIEKFLNYL